MNKIIENADEYLMHTYNRFQICLEKGDGVYLYDTDGKKYLDFASGIGVFALGYHNKEYNDSLKDQIDKILHTSNLFYNPPLAKAAENFAKNSGMDEVFFTSSGTEAIEGAIKLAKKYYFNKTGHADGEIIAMNHSFHGRSMGALAVTGQPKYQKAFGPMIPGIVFADYNDFDSVKAQLTDKTCAIIMETVQGEGGLYPAHADFIKAVRALCDEKDIVLILDEIQCGMGRSGYMFAYEYYGVKPDIVTSAKALGCGVPVGAFAAIKKVADAFVPGDHGTTYGGNPFATNAVNTVFALYEKNNLLDHVKETAAYLEQKLDALVAKYDFMKERRGLGLMQGIECDGPVIDIIKKAQTKGLIVISAGANILRFLPPLVITKENIDEMISILEDSMN